MLFRVACHGVNRWFDSIWRELALSQVRHRQVVKASTNRQLLHFRCPVSSVGLERCATNAEVRGSSPLRGSISDAVRSQARPGPVETLRDVWAIGYVSAVKTPGVETKENASARSPLTVDVGDNEPAILAAKPDFDSASFPCLVSSVGRASES